MKKIATLCISSFIFLASPVYALQAYTARYKIELKGLSIGESHHQLFHLDNGFTRMTVRSEPYLKLIPYRFIQESVFTLTDSIIPHKHFYDSRELKKKHNKKGTLYFNWTTKHVTNPSIAWQTTIKNGTQDKLTHLLQLRLDLINKKTSLHYPIAEEDRIIDYHFSIIKSERLHSPLGPLDTVKIKHVDHKGQITFSWLAKDYEYLPIKMEHYRNGAKLGGAYLISYGHTTDINSY